MNKKIIQVRFPNDEIAEYEDIQKLRDEILSGLLKKHYQARLNTDTKWKTLENFSTIDFRLHSLYKPIWAFSQRFFWYGLWFGLIVYSIILFRISVGTLFAGAMLGGSLGLVIGTIVGHLRRNKAIQAPDAIPEGFKPYILGFLFPLLFLIVFLAMMIGYIR